MKDVVVSWFLRNIILPKIEDINNPGFIILKLSGEKRETYLREVMFPEQLLTTIEKSVVAKYGAAGGQAMYSAGKKFGWEYASTSNFNRISESSVKELESFSYNLVRYIECSFASKLTHKLDLKNKLFRILMKDFVICSKDGFGYLMSSGGISGIWAFMMHDKSVEGIEPKCQGRGDRMCEVICAPLKVLRGMGLKPKFVETDLQERKITKEYLSFNKIRTASYATKSMKDMVASGMFEHAHGIMNFRKERYFLLESSCIYLLEKELCKLKGGDGLMYKLAFDFGKSLVTGPQTPAFITDYMSALGWGDVYASVKDGHYRVVSLHYPWTEYAADSNFIIFRGLVSGMLSKITGKQVDLKEVQSSLTSGSLDIIAS